MSKQDTPMDSGSTDTGNTEFNLSQFPSEAEVGAKIDELFSSGKAYDAGTPEEDTPEDEQVEDTKLEGDTPDEEDLEEAEAEEAPKEDTDEAEADPDDNDESEGDKEVEVDLDAIAVKVDGETKNVTFEELKRGYQTDKSNTQKSMDLAKDKEQFEADKANNEYLKFRGDALKDFYDIKAMEIDIDEAKSWIKDNPKSPVSKINEARNYIDLRTDAIDKLAKGLEEKSRNTKLPGQDLLAKKMPNMSEAQAKDLGKILADKGMPVELVHSGADPVSINLAIEVSELRTKLSAFESRKMKFKRTAKVTKNATPTRATKSKDGTAKSSVTESQKADARKRVQAGTHTEQDLSLLMGGMIIRNN